MRQISKARFEALSYARIPFVKFISEDIEWYSNDNNAVLGAILLDKIDNDYVAIVLGRDEAGVFRFIDQEHSIPQIVDARAILLGKMEHHSKDGAEEFPQGVITRKKHLIFEYIEKREPMPDDYKLLTECDLFSPAKELIAEIAYSFEDPDGNYIEQFQSSGFNSRMWELYLYAFFHEADFMINREFNAPDYVVEKMGQRICVEAVTVNPSQHADNEPEPKSHEEIERLLKDYMPIKYGSPLFSKLNKRYWEKEHVAGNPLLIAIHDFHQTDSMMWSRSALERYLYGAERQHRFENGEVIQEVTQISEHRWNEKVIPSNYFALDDAKNISAIIHSNQATIGKFLRMGYLAEFGRRDLDIKFVGQGIHFNNQIPLDFEFEVTNGEYAEYWSDSITIYHNPNALNPLDPDLFPNVAHVFFGDGQFSSIKPAFYPIYGRTRYRVKET
ncbi:hypothetical protein [Photobacterium leiognathi]|uniref:hypothetical protein n=1 Tax=Photobacterium leiognathi TaxID=553611 RepID=UPI002981D1B1|nr:hypothetical protein [Photobacterium leiognathi]